MTGRPLPQLPYSDTFAKSSRVEKNKENAIKNRRDGKDERSTKIEKQREIK